MIGLENISLLSEKGKISTMPYEDREAPSDGPYIFYAMHLIHESLSNMQ